MPRPITPLLAVDILVERYDDTKETPEILLIKRKNAPLGWALPGGFVTEGERLAVAAARELHEETGLVLSPNELCFTKILDEPLRDQRSHVVAVVYSGFVDVEDSEVEGSDDALDAQWFPLSSLPIPIVFDHESTIKEEYEHYFSDSVD